MGSPSRMQQGPWGLTLTSDARFVQEPPVAESAGDEHAAAGGLVSARSTLQQRQLTKPGVYQEFCMAARTVSAIMRAESTAAWFAVKALITVAEPPSLSIETTVTITPAP